MPSPLEPFLDRQGVVLLDGGLATELEMRGADLGDELWSARLLLDDPELIRQVNLDYLEAGADVITTASYQATFEGFARRGLSEAAGKMLLRRSVELACEAREQFWSRAANRQNRLRPLVAASIGPYGAFLADGSEYTGAYDLSEDALVDFHRRRFEILAGSGADLLACETLPNRAEARALRRLLETAPDARAWLSFSCRDAAHLADGTPLAELAAEIEGCDQILALAVNCVPPRLVPALLSELRRATAKPLGAYPNSGEGWDADQRAWTPAAEGADFGAACRSWVAAGARLVGGCCRTRPADVRRMRGTLLVGEGQSSAVHSTFIPGC